MLQPKVVPLCACKVHSCDREDFYHLLTRLCLTHPPLTDDTDGALLYFEGCQATNTERLWDQGRDLWNGAVHPTFV